MKRFHVHIAVDDLARSITFYSGLFASPPTVQKPDYAKWMLEDPRVNFAISARGAKPGIEHLGIQVENQQELNEVYARLKTVEGPILAEGETACCYARSDKNWITDPVGVPWEAFLTVGENTTYGTEAPTRAKPLGLPMRQEQTACCVPAADADCKD